MESISRKFEHVLECVYNLAKDIIRPSDPSFSTVHPKIANHKYAPFFDNAIGAIDGTHVKVIVPGKKVGPYFGRSKEKTQNVLAICDFDRRFTFVAAGIPGSAHDWTVLQEVMFRHNDKFPHPPPGTGPWGCIGFHISVINWYICFVTYGKFCRQVLPGGLGIPEPAGISTTLQGSEVPCR